MKKIIVTGGAGFIGSHLVEHLVNSNYRVIVIDNLCNGSIHNLNTVINKIKFIKKDISNLSKYIHLFKDIDCVFHLAALADIVPSIELPHLYFKSNVEATSLLLEICKKYKVRKFIYAASSSCYGIPKKYPTNELSKIDPQYPYALSKYMAEEIVMHYGKIYKMNVTSLRLFNVYGPRSRTSGAYGAVFGVFLKQKLENYPYTVVGNGKQTRDFTYVSDVVNAFIKAYKSKFSSNQIFNVGSGKSISINKIVKLLSGKKIYIPKRPGEPKKTHADISKIKRILKWKPKIWIDNGIPMLLKHISYWQKAPLWTRDKIKIVTETWFKYLK